MTSFEVIDAAAGIRRFQPLKFMKLPSSATSGAVLAILSIGLPAEGAILFDNLSNTSGGSGIVTTAIWQAQRFTTDSVAYQLDDIVLLMGRASGGGTASVSIWSDVSSLPGALLYSLALNDPEGYTEAFSETKFTSSQAVHLAANSTFWVALQSADPSSEFEWSFTEDQTGSGAGFSTIWSEGHVISNVVTWNPAEQQDPYQMQVNATAVSAVPEPASVALFWGLIGSGLLLRRRI